jgi:hypothetical protein
MRPIIRSFDLNKYELCWAIVPDDYPTINCLDLDVAVLCENDSVDLDEIVAKGEPIQIRAPLKVWGKVYDKHLNRDLPRPGPLAYMCTDMCKMVDELIRVCSSSALLWGNVDPCSRPYWFGDSKKYPRK